MKEKALEGKEGRRHKELLDDLTKKQILELETESTRRQGRRRKELLDDLTKKRDNGT